MKSYYTMKQGVISNNYEIGNINPFSPSEVLVIKHNIHKPSNAQQKLKNAVIAICVWNCFPPQYIPPPPLFQSINYTKYIKQELNWKGNYTNLQLVKSHGHWKSNFITKKGNLIFWHSLLPHSPLNWFESIRNKY